jgi:hypothetical protein
MRAKRSVERKMELPHIRHAEEAIGNARRMNPAKPSLVCSFFAFSAKRTASNISEMALSDRLDSFRNQAGILHVAVSGNPGADPLAKIHCSASLGASAVTLPLKNVSQG